MMGYYYEYICRDFYAAEYWYRRAIAFGNDVAIYNLAYLCHHHNIWTCTRTTEIIKNYSLAIEKNNVDAMNNLGYYYVNNDDHIKAEKYYLMAADLGHPTATYNLGCLYSKYYDYGTAIKYFLRAANMGSCNAIRQINCELNQRFDIILAVRSYDFLDEVHLYRLNDFIARCYNNLKN